MLDFEGNILFIAIFGLLGTIMLAFFTAHFLLKPSKTEPVIIEEEADSEILEIIEILKQRGIVLDDSSVYSWESGEGFIDVGIDGYIQIKLAGDVT